jgi:hypothetical protein
VESYSIKRLKPLCGYDRRVDLAEATARLIAVEAALEDGTAAGDGERQRVVAGYNEVAGRAAAGGRELAEQPQQQERLVRRPLLVDRCLPEAGQPRQQLVARQAVAFSWLVKVF